MKKKLFITLVIAMCLVAICGTIEVTAVSSTGSNIRNELHYGNYSISGIMIRITQLILFTVGAVIAIIGLINFIKYLKTDKENKKDRNLLSTKAFLEIFFGAGIFGTGMILGMIQSFKPVIYLYPEKEEEVTVKLKKPEKLTCTYPKYKDGWEVIAKPNGDLIEKETGRNFYSLYWEGKNEVKHDLTEGFIVEGKDAEKFLEEKLEILGLNEREAQEFIIYWLPELEKNKYNFIRFETMEQINEDMPLEITPKPDTVIRIMMVSKKILMPYEVKEQKLETPERKGFTVVEWGGTRI